MTRGTPASSQIIFLEQKVEQLNDELQAKDEMIADLKVATAHYIEVANMLLPEIEKKDARIAELEAKCERLKHLTDPQIDRIVIASLKKQYHLESTFGKDPDESLLKSLNSVISLYSTVDEYKDWMKEKQELDQKNEIYNSKSV